MAYAQNYPLFAAQAANADSSGIDWPGGRGSFVAAGTWGGATAKLQWSPDGGTTWLDVDRSGDTYVTLTANGAGGFELPPCRIRANLAGITTTSVTASVASTDA